MLKKEYPEADVDNIELNFYVFGSSDFTFHITDFEEKDGKLVYKNGKLPEMKKEEKTEDEYSEGNEPEEKPEDKQEEKEEEKNPENEPQKQEIDKEEKEENLEKAQDGFASRDEAEEAAKKALESDFANDSYDLFQGTNGRWYYSLKVS